MPETPQISTQPGSISLACKELPQGKNTLRALGFKESDLMVAGGNLRFEIRFDSFSGKHLYKNPTIVFKYSKQIGESQWIVEFNGSTLLDKQDHSGRQTVLILKRDVLEKSVKANDNLIIVHGDFGFEISLDPEGSFLHLDD